MPNRSVRWCPNFCGKSVVFNPKSQSDRKPFKCGRCNKGFSHKQMGLELPKRFYR